MSPIKLRVAELRERHGWTQKELAEKAGIGRMTVIRIERATNRRIDYEVLEKLAEVFGVDPSYLLVTTKASKRGRQADR